MNKRLRFFLQWVWMIPLLIWFILTVTANEKSNTATNESQIIFSIPYDQPTCIIFGDDVGRLSWEDGKMSFEGDTHESAKLFFEYLKGYIDSYIDSEMEKNEESPNLYFEWDQDIEPCWQYQNKNMPCLQNDYGELYTYPESEIPEETLLEFTTGGVLKDDFKPVNFIKVTDTDLSRCFINDRLRINLNGKRYWLRLEEDINGRPMIKND